MNQPPEPFRSRSWSGLGSSPEEGRGFFQEGLKLFALVTLLMSVSFFVLLRVIFTVLGGLSLGDSLGQPASLFHLAMVALLAVVWAACRRGRWSLAALESIDAAAIFLVGIGYALMGHSARLLGPAEYLTVMAMTVTLFARAATVPSERLARALPADLEEAVLRCLGKETGERPADALALRATLVAGGNGTSWGEAEEAAWWREHGAALRRRERPGRDPASALGRTIESALTVPSK